MNAAPRRVPLMFRQDESRFTLFPIKHDDVWEFYKKSEASFWTTEEIDLGSDDFAHLTAEEQTFVKKVLAFFSFADGIVVENLAENFCAEVQWPEARSFYGFQIAMENIHSETYSLLIDHFAKEDKHILFGALNSHPALRKKAEWMMQWMRAGNSFAERLVAFACVEGIHFSAAFSCLFWCKKRGLPINGLLFSNELISRDEGLHCDFACLMHSKLWSPGKFPAEAFHAALRHTEYDVPLPRVTHLDLSTESTIRDSIDTAYPSVPESTRDAMKLDVIASMKCSDETVLSIIRSACEVEFDFIRTEALPVRLIGMNSDTAVEYVKFVANRLSAALGVDGKEPYPGATNPYDWMSLISLNGKTNFFERRVSEYQKAGVMGSLAGNHEKKFSMEEDF